MVCGRAYGISGAGACVTISGQECGCERFQLSVFMEIVSEI